MHPHGQTAAKLAQREREDLGMRSFNFDSDSTVYTQVSPLVCGSAW